jgi:hypothetical protein
VLVRSLGFARKEGEKQRIVELGGPDKRRGKRRIMPSIYKNDIALLLYDHEHAGVGPIRTTVGPRLMLSYAGKRLWGRARQCHAPATKRSMIESRSTSASPIRISPEQERVWGIGCGCCYVRRRRRYWRIYRDREREEERKKERKKTKTAGWKERKAISIQWRSSRWGFFVMASCHCHLPLPLPAVQQVKDRNKNKKR